jgi:hypothetical protein
VAALIAVLKINHCPGLSSKGPRTLLPSLRQGCHFLTALCNDHGIVAAAVLQLAWMTAGRAAG